MYETLSTVVSDSVRINALQSDKKCRWILFVFFKNYLRKGDFKNTTENTTKPRDLLKTSAYMTIML